MKILWKIVKGIITAFLIVILVMVIFQKFTKNRLTIGNYYIFQVISGSMLPEYKVGDIIIVKKVSPKDLKKGDDVTYLGRFANLNGLIVTHKIVDLRQEDGKYYYVTKGDANSIEDPEIEYDDIYGKVVYHTIVFSFVGRLMTNIVIYYLLFVFVGVGFSYDIISSFILKKE